MAELDLLVKGGLVLKQEMMEYGQIGVRNGVIVGLYARSETPSAKETVDATGMIVFPGIVDSHVHSYSNLAEGFEHSTPAAAAGGVTTIIEMPYDATGKQTTLDRFRTKIELVERVASVDVALLATLEQDGNVDGVSSLLEAGACGFKLSVTEADPVRFPRINDGVLWRVLPALAEHKVTVGFHAENEEIINALIGRFQADDNIGPRAHCQSRPPASETTAVLKLLELAFWSGCRLHVHHVSHPRSVCFARAFREEGVDVTVETCPHYLILAEEDMDRVGAFAKINPPLRSREEAEEMWRLVKDDRVDMLTSDHAPWPRDKKSSENIFENASGSPGVETLLPLIYSEGVAKRQLSPVQLARMLCTNPAQRFNLYPRKGHIAVGADADLTILDPAAHWTIRAEDMRSSPNWTPYDGMEVQGRVVRTILRGQTIYDGRDVTAKPGDGVFVPASRRM